MNNLNELIEKSGLKKQKIAELIGVSPATITRYVANQTLPNAKKLEKLAKALNVKIDEIFFDEINH